MRNYILLLISITLFSCGFKGSQEDTVVGSSQLQSNNDYDGDLILNEEETNFGTNPYIADLPSLKVRFLQNYKIQVDYKINNPRRTDTSNLEVDPTLPDENVLNFVIDTKVGKDDPDFKYRVGRIFIRDKAFNDSAKIGQFADHSWGEIKEHDLSWVKYPKVDSTFFAKTVLDYKTLLTAPNVDIKNIKASLENSVKLKSNSLYKEIKNLELNFYYYDYEKESYQLITTKKIDRIFKAGVNEIFDVEIENLPTQLIEHNYMKKGEFIISEVKDFEIPKLKTTYKRLMASVRAKSIPVILNTPLEQEAYYIGIKGKSESFLNILHKIFAEKVTIQNNKLIKINQFQSNLPKYDYLSEIKNEDKKGKWFVFTNKLNKHYLNYSFKSSDVISLSYILGKELANQNEEKIFSFKRSVSSTPNSAIYPLGNITHNSKVNIQLKPEMVFGERKSYDKIHFVAQPQPCNGNCVFTPFECHIDVNAFHKINKMFTFKKDLSDKFSKISLLINENEYSLKQLIEEKKVIVRWKASNIHLLIKNINDIEELDTFEENLISLKLKGINETTFNGFRLLSWHGPAHFRCPQVMAENASHFKLPISVESFKFKEWSHWFNWNVLQRGESRNWKQEFSIGLFSLIQNNYN